MPRTAPLQDSNSSSSTNIAQNAVADAWSRPNPQRGSGYGANQRRTGIGRGRSAGSYGRTGIVSAAILFQITNVDAAYVSIRSLIIDLIPASLFKNRHDGAVGDGSQRGIRGAGPCPYIQGTGRDFTAHNRRIGSWIRIAYRDIRIAVTIELDVPCRYVGNSGLVRDTMPVRTLGHNLHCCSKGNGSQGGILRARTGANHKVGSGHGTGYAGAGRCIGGKRSIRRSSCDYLGRLDISQRAIRGIIHQMPSAARLENLDLGA